MEILDIAGAIFVVGIGIGLGVILIGIGYAVYKTFKD